MLLGCDSAKAIYTDDNRNAATDITLEECRITLLAANNTPSTAVIALHTQGLLKKRISHRFLMSGDFTYEAYVCILCHLKPLSRLHIKIKALCGLYGM
jgi:hypothetical protein